MTFLTVDVETTIKTSFKRKANAFDPENWVVWIGYSYANGPVQTRKFKSKEESQGWFADLMDEYPDTKIQVGFNYKFDLLHAIVNDERSYKRYMKFIADGGQIWDVQLAEYLLRGMTQSSHMMALDEVAPKYGGTIKPDQVKEMWNAGIDTPDIPDDLMLEYLPGDIDNTRKSFLGQIVQANKVGQTKSILLNMGSLVYTIEAEKNGMAVDQELGLLLAKELEEQLDQLLATLGSYLPKDLPFEFNWGSGTQLSALIFGGTVKYDVKAPMFDDDMQPVYFQLKEQHYLTADGGTISCDTYNSRLVQGDQATPLPILSYNLSGRNKGEPKTKQVTVPDIARGQKTRIEERHFSFPGVTKPRENWKTAKEGVYQTNADVIKALGNQGIPFLEALAKRAKVAKDLGTYFISTDSKGQPCGMLTLVQLDGLIHHMLNHTSTVTGRFSSSNPNMQNIPKSVDGGDKVHVSKIKQVFVSRWGADGRLIQSDFTALEIYIQAILTKCKQMIQDLLEGLDMHCARVATAEGISYEEALRLCKAEAIPEWVAKRTKAKIFSFQRAYGAGAQLISDGTGIPLEEVKALIDAESARYPEVDTFYAELGKVIASNATGCHKVIPHPDFPAKQVALRTSSYRTPDGKLYSYMEQPAPKFVVERQGVWTSFSPTEIKNYIVQGGGAEWAKAAMWMMVREFYRRENFGGKGLIVNQVHDACYADSHISVALEVAAVTHVCMETATDFMQECFQWECPVKVPSETMWGLNLADEVKIEGLTEAAAPLYEVIRTRYIKPFIDSRKSA